MLRHSVARVALPSSRAVLRIHAIPMHSRRCLATDSTPPPNSNNTDNKPSNTPTTPASSSSSSPPSPPSKSDGKSKRDSEAAKAFIAEASKKLSEKNVHGGSKYDPSEELPDFVRKFAEERMSKQIEDEFEEYLRTNKKTKGGTWREWFRGAQGTLVTLAMGVTMLVTSVKLVRLKGESVAYQTQAEADIAELEFKLQASEAKCAMVVERLNDSVAEAEKKAGKKTASAVVPVATITAVKESVAKMEAEYKARLEAGLKQLQKDIKARKPGGPDAKKPGIAELTVPAAAPATTTAGAQTQSTGAAGDQQQKPKKREIV